MPTAVKTKRKRAPARAARRKRLAPEDARLVEDRILRTAVRRSFETFFRAFPPAIDYEYGRHTLAMFGELQRVTEALERGENSYLIINVPPRHGKSDQSSRRWPAWNMLRNPHLKVLLVAHNDELASDFSRSARACFREAGPLFGLRISRELDSIKRWGVEDEDGNQTEGAFRAFGIQSGIVGHGGHLIVIDDYLRGQEEAESRRQRDKLWDTFSADVLTRRMAPHAVVIVVTRWHEDDLVGRITQANDPKHKKYNPKMPVFRVVKFPARAEDGSWLFPELFDDEHYESACGSLSPYFYNSLMQQDPVPREGNLLHAERVQFLDDAEFDDMVRGYGVRLIRGWDLASSKKQVTGSDPDHSCGTLAGYKDGRLFVSDEVSGQWRGKTRDDIIRDTALRDGPATKVIIEVVAGYKDAFEHAKDELRGLATVTSFTPAVDKVAKATILESVFEAGCVYARRAEWNSAWVQELVAFPGAPHDDKVDGLLTAVHDQVIGRGRLFLSG